jgi:hypothetical protein
MHKNKDYQKFEANYVGIVPAKRAYEIAEEQRIRQSKHDDKEYARNYYKSKGL